MALEQIFIQKVVYIGCPNKQLPVLAFMYAPLPYPKHAVVIFAYAFFFFGGLVVSMPASGTQDRGFDPGRSRRIFRAKKIHSMPSLGGK